MNALFLKDLAAKTHRGIRGRVEDGKSGGGLCFGYNVLKPLNAHGDPIRGDREINEAEASVVRRIFREFATGAGPRAIARTLNKEDVPGPAGKLWSDTTIRGHVKRGTGLVNNELYIGRLIWNRLRYIKDPSTGKRVARLNPNRNGSSRMCRSCALSMNSGFSSCPTGRDRRKVCQRDRSRGQAPQKERTERHTSAEVPSVRLGVLWLLRRPLLASRRWSVCLREPHQQGRLFK